MQIVKLGDLGIAAFEHLDIQLAGNDANLLGRQATDHAIHQFAPGPETVLRIARHLGQTGHYPLKGVGMQIRHAGNDRPREPLAAFSAGVCTTSVIKPCALTSRRTSLAQPVGNKARASKKSGHGRFLSQVWTVKVVTKVAGSKYCSTCETFLNSLSIHIHMAVKSVNCWMLVFLTKSA